MRVRPQGWFRPGQLWLRYPSVSNVRWLGSAGIDIPVDYMSEEIDDDLADRVLDAFGAFGTPQECAQRLLRAHEEVGLNHAFLFPVHTWDTTYDLPRAEVEAYGSVIGPALRAAGC